MSDPADKQARDIFAPTFYDDQPNTQRFNEPALISPQRELTDYDRARRETHFDPISAFTPPGTEQIAPPRVFSIDLSVAHTNEKLDISGNVLWYQRSTNISDLVSFRYGDQASDAVDFQPGNALGGVPFDRLYFTNTVIAGAVAKILIFSIPGQKLFLL